MSIQSKAKDSFQSIKEEIANSITHGLGAIFSIVGLIALLYQAITKGTAKHIFSCSFYGGSLVLLYVVSTLYHSITHKTAKKVFRRLDHISIYLLILGTYIPLTLLVLKGAVGWTFFGIQCGLTAFGITFKAIFGPKFEVLSTIFYLLMGSMALIIIKPIYLALSFKGMMYILYGGFFYVLGILFYALDKKVPFFHSIWHVFVLAGSFFHYFLVLLFVVPFAV
ncbi:MAG: hypothetical protein KR126chlam5_00860 [Candidatus Anoxychlamydiales bacterium]|nr:hypothetical protein [Candidatus Anoxychlamydiales bacterium]NGX52557.1 hypothetical protein [Candidatus Anoxychlamydiales bacterium]